MAAIEQCLADDGWRDGIDRFTRRERGAGPEGEED
jgi:hypothetical protein